MADSAQSKIANSMLSLYANPHIFELENKPRTVLAHEIGAGSRCLICKDDCPGLDLHFWRKICKVCRCRLDNHDIQTHEHDHAKIIIGRLFDSPPMKFSTLQTQKDSSIIEQPVSKKNQSMGTCADRNIADGTTQYTWTPCQDSELIEKYMNSLPAQERPIVDTDGAQLRRRRLAYQLPFHDCDPDSVRSVVTQVERDFHNKYIANIKAKVVGMGKIVDWQAESHHTVQEGGNPSEKHCRDCHSPIGTVGVTTDHGRMDDIWHPNCFRCAQCRQPLVDMLYFYKDDVYYCERHFGDSLHPRCAGCDELIFAPEYTRAEEQHWHLNHFCCFGCDLELGGHRYMVNSDQPYCLDCYMVKFARLCQRCQQKIGPDVQKISHDNLNWHANDECFSCSNCDLTLLNKRFLIKAKTVYCSSKCKAQFRSRKS